MHGFLNKYALIAGLALLGPGALAAPMETMPRAIAPALNTEDSIDSTPIEVVTEPPPPGTHQGQPAAAPQPAVAQTPVIAPPPPISESPMATPSLAGFGIADAGTDGIPAGVWRNSTAASSLVLLQFMHSGVANPDMQDLIVRLLTTQATPPAGADDNWFAQRVYALVAMGRDDKADQMIASIPASLDTGAMRQLHVELMLARGDYDLACKQPRPDLGIATSDSAFWQKLSILCQARGGKQNEAMVGIDLLREQNQLGNDFFAQAIRKIGDKNAAITTLPQQWSLMDVALVRLAGAPEALRDHLDSVPPVTLKYLAQDASLDIKLRDRAAGKAKQLGIIAIKDSDKTPEQPFARPLASDVETLVRALGSGKPANADDNAVIARLAIDEGSMLDVRRIERLLTLMQPFGYNIPPTVWQKLFAHKARFDGDMPPAMLVAGLNDAAQTGRKGDVIVLSALVLDGTDSDRIGDFALLPVIRALQAAGFEKEARMIAYSAVKSYRGS